MISLFRKIRQKLLSQNQVTRYLVYAIGEIVIVVIWKSSPFMDSILVEQTNANPPSVPLGTG